jgi:hypothetical protein
MEQNFHKSINQENLITEKKIKKPELPSLPPAPSVSSPPSASLPTAPSPCSPRPTWNQTFTFTFLAKITPALLHQPLVRSQPRVGGGDVFLHLIQLACETTKNGTMKIWPK